MNTNLLREAVKKHGFDASAWKDDHDISLGRVINCEDLLNMADDVDAMDSASLSAKQMREIEKLRAELAEYKNMKPHAFEYTDAQGSFISKATPSELGAAAGVLVTELFAHPKEKTE